MQRTGTFCGENCCFFLVSDRIILILKGYKHHAALWKQDFDESGKQSMSLFYCSAFINSLQGVSLKLIFVCFFFHLRIDTKLSVICLMLSKKPVSVLYIDFIFMGET